MYNGALVIDEQSILPSDYDWGDNFWFTIFFTTPYTYTGGDLIIEISHGTRSGSAIEVDAWQTANNANGFRAMTATGPTVAVAVVPSAVVPSFQLSYEA